MKSLQQITHKQMIKPLAAAIAASLMSTAALADGRLEGRVTDWNNKANFDGAQVTIKELETSTATKNGGRFVFAKLPAGSYTLRVDYLGADSVEQTITITDEQTTRQNIQIGEQVALMENTIVVGQAAGASSALNQQRMADNMKSIVSSDAIGQLPDENVSEALQRVPGVFIERDQGEGRFVGIRGIDPNLNSSSINGLNIPSPENDKRAVALDVIPSELVQELVVTKTLTPDMDGDAIGGNINVKSLSAFDREDGSFSLTAEAGYNDLVEEASPKIAGSITELFETDAGDFGVAFAASWQNRKFGSDNIETDGGWPEDLEDSGYRGAEEIEHRKYEIERERLGLALNLDWRPSDNSEYYLRTLHSKFEDNEIRQRAEYKLDKGDLDSISADSALWLEADMDRDLKNRYESQEITSISLGGENRIDSWTLEYNLGLSMSEESEPNRRDTDFGHEGIAQMGYSSIGEIPSLFASSDAFDTTGFVMNELVVENNKAEDEQVSFKFDVTREMGFGELKFGTKISQRDKEKDVNADIYDGFVGDPTMDQFSTANVDYSHGNFGPGLDQALVNQYIDANINDFERNDDESLLSSSRDYQMSEDINAAYVMANHSLGDLRLVYGIRYEATDFAANGYNVLDNDGDIAIAPANYTNDYDNWLPGVNARYQATDNVILRGAYTQSLSRPSFGDLSPSPETLEIDDEGKLEVEAGNPLLKPYEADNLDFSVEYYPGNIGILSAGVFYKQIDNFIYTAQVGESIELTQFAGSLTVTEADVLQAQNGDSADLYGMELQWTKRFDSLPGAWQGLMLMANATFTDSDAELNLPEGSERSSSVNLPNQADTVGNLVLGYEYAGVSLRLSGNYRGDMLKEIDYETAAQDLYLDSHAQVDFTAKYDINENFQVNFSAINLTDEPMYLYNGDRQYNAQYESYGSSYSLGLVWRNF